MNFFPVIYYQVHPESEIARATEAIRFESFDCSKLKNLRIIKHTKKED